MPRLAATAATLPFTDPVSFTANGAGQNGGGQPTLRFAVPFVLTNPVRVTADGAQALRLAVPVTPFHELNLSLQVYSMVGATTVSVAVETAMQNEDEGGWQTIDTFSGVVTSPTTTVKVFRGLLRYVRYRVSLNGASEITFAVQGVAYGSQSARTSGKQCAGNCGGGSPGDSGGTSARFRFMDWICDQFSREADECWARYRATCRYDQNSDYCIAFAKQCHDARDGEHRCNELAEMWG